MPEIDAKRMTVEITGIIPKNKKQQYKSRLYSKIVKLLEAEGFKFDLEQSAINQKNDDYHFHVRYKLKD